MDALTRFLATNRMSLKELASYRHTDEYLHMAALHYGTESNESKELDSRIRHKNQSAWYEALATAFGQLELPPGEPTLPVIKTAERLMCEAGFTPPHWTNTSECDSCGILPAPPGAKAQVIHCPWCDTIIGQKAL